MQNKKTIIKITSLFLILIIVLTTLSGCGNLKTEDVNSDTKNFKMVTSFYPLYIALLNITDGAENVEVENMTDSNIHCLHDYTLTTQDLVKLEKADVFITNGLGIENFINKVTETYQNLNIIDSSKNIKNIIKTGKENNAHIWLDIDNYMKQVENIANELIILNPENEEIYKQNTAKYIGELEFLSGEIRGNIQREEPIEVISFSESLDYLAGEFKLNIRQVDINHEGTNLSAEKLNELIKYVQTNNVKVVILDEDTNRNSAEALANETGAKIYTLDAGLDGAFDKGSYVSMMLNNLDIVLSMEE